MYFCYHTHTIFLYRSQRWSPERTSVPAPRFSPARQFWAQRCSDAGDVPQEFPVPGRLSLPPEPSPSPSVPLRAAVRPKSAFSCPNVVVSPHLVNRLPPRLSSRFARFRDQTSPPRFPCNFIFLDAAGTWFVSDSVFKSGHAGIGLSPPAAEVVRDLHQLVLSFPFFFPLTLGPSDGALLFVYCVTEFGWSLPAGPPPRTQTFLSFHSKKRERLVPNTLYFI